MIDAKSEVKDEDDEPYARKIIEDLGDTPGQDRALKLSCGHTILESLGSNYISSGPPGTWVGGTAICYYCANPD